MIVDSKPSAEKSLKKIHKEEQRKIRTRIREIGRLNDVSQILSSKLKNHANRYKVRIGDYRMVYKKVSENHILITAIAHRKQVYKKLFIF